MSDITAKEKRYRKEVKELRAQLDHLIDLPLVAANVLDQPATIFSTGEEGPVENIVTNETPASKKNDIVAISIRALTLITVEFHVR